MPDISGTMPSAEGMLRTPPSDITSNNSASTAIAAAAPMTNPSTLFANPDMLLPRTTAPKIASRIYDWVSPPRQGWTRSHLFSKCSHTQCAHQRQGDGTNGLHGH